MAELAELTEVCRKMGAPAGQAGVMAAQIMKRAGQLAVERSMSREAAIAYVLRLVTQGRAGEVPTEMSSPIIRPTDQNSTDSRSK